MKSAHSESKYQISPPLLASLFCVSLSSEPPQQVKDEGQPILHQGNHYQNVPLTLDLSGQCYWDYQLQQWFLQRDNFQKKVIFSDIVISLWTLPPLVTMSLNLMFFF